MPATLHHLRRTAGTGRDLLRTPRTQPPTTGNCHDRSSCHHGPHQEKRPTNICSLPSRSQQSPQQQGPPHSYPHHRSPEYDAILPLFSKTVACLLPQRRIYHHVNPLKEGTEAPFSPLYSMLRLELLALKEFLEANLSKGFIKASSSSAGALVLFVKKSNGSLRQCVD